jgi:hypothetical protein
VLFLDGLLGASDRQRDTKAGLTAAARWLGVREYLRNDEVFPDLPPAAVAVWDRYLAYGAAMGVAAGAVRALPMGAEDDHRAWSSYGGQWHQVNVRYPRLPPGRGRHPVGAFFLALFWGAVAVIALVRLDAVTRPEASPSLQPSFIDWIMRARTAGIVVCLVVVAWAVLILVRAVPDMFVNKQVVGKVLRLREHPRFSLNPYGRKPKRWYFIAVDDGKSKKVRAWAMRHPDTYQRLDQYQEVIGVITPALPYVRSIERAAPPPVVPRGTGREAQMEGQPAVRR